MKIAHIILKGMPMGGGIEVLTEGLALELVKRGHDVTVYTMRHYGIRDGLYHGARIKTIPTPRVRSLEKMTGVLLATLYECTLGDAQIIHYHAFGPAVFSLLPRLAGRKVVVQGHGMEWKRSKWGLLARIVLKLLERPSVKFPHAVTVPSLLQKRYLWDSYRVQSIVIPQAIAPHEKERPELIQQYALQGEDYILFAGRLVREKGVHYLIQAYQQLSTHLKLVIAGDAQYEEEYKTYLARLAEENENILFLGHVTGRLLRELFSNCYLFVLPSEIEGISIALLEAMSYGNCCLVSDIDENVEALCGLGYTFKNKDIPDLRRKLAFLLENEAVVRAVRSASRRHVLEHHDWTDCVMRFEALYHSLLQSV